MAAKKLKDWSKELAELSTYGYETVNGLYSDMLATAHDIGLKVPDELLIETEEPDALKKVIPPLHDALVKFHAEKSAAEKTKKSADKAPSKKESAPKKPAKTAVQKEIKSKEESTMAKTATAKKTAPKAAPAKKVAKKASKKASSSNARTAAGGGTRYTGEETIHVKIKTNPAREGSGRFERVARIIKYNGKKVKDFVKAGGVTASLHFAVGQGWITVK